MAVSSKDVNTSACHGPVINVMPPEERKSCCPDSIRNITTHIVLVCSECFDKAKNWCHSKYYKHRTLVIVTPKAISLLLYVLDLGTDIFTAVRHFSNKHYWWGSLTVIFTILPMLSLSSGLIIHVSQITDDSMNIKCLPSVTAIMCSPILPFGWMMLDIVASINNPDDDTESNGNSIVEVVSATAVEYDSVTATAAEDVNTISTENANLSTAEDANITAVEDAKITVAENANITAAENLIVTAAKDTNITVSEDVFVTTNEDSKFTAAQAAKLIKLFVTVLASYPQAALQLFIVFQVWLTGEDVVILQWITIATSLTSLSVAVSTGYLNQFAATSSKIIFLIFGLLAISSRLVVCCVYSMINTRLWLVPFGTELVTSSMVWTISFIYQRVVNVQHVESQGKCTGFFIFVLTESYNSFTLSGLLISGINLGYAVGAHFLDEEEKRVPSTVAIVSTTLAALSITFNVMFTTIPYFRKIKEDWMRLPEVQEIHN